MLRLAALLFLISAPAFAADLETLSDDDLVALVKAEKRVVVLFAGRDCPECAAHEKALLDARDELVDSLGAWVVRVQDSQLMRLYTPGREPAIVYFRHGVPMLYDGPVDEDHLVQTFVDNKEPNVRELSDDNFEHLTQASSGATTGDWFVMFYSGACVECQRLGARWEAVASAVRARGVVVARADRKGAAAATARRFGVTNEPTFLLFRRGKMYRYELPKTDVRSFVAFTQDWYRNAKSENVPVPKTPFDDLVAVCVYLMRDAVNLGAAILTAHPWIWQIGVVGFGLVAITSAIAVFKAGRTTDGRAKKVK